jgi:hypothetical protein
MATEAKPRAEDPGLKLGTGQKAPFLLGQIPSLRRCAGHELDVRLDHDPLRLDLAFGPRHDREAVTGLRISPMFKVLDLHLL